MKIENLDFNELVFSKLEPIGHSKGFIMTTHIDRQKEKFTLELLDKALEKTKERVWINSNHNPSKTPVGKIVSSEIKQMDDKNTVFTLKLIFMIKKL